MPSNMKSSNVDTKTHAYVSKRIDHCTVSQSARRWVAADRVNYDTVSGLYWALILLAPSCGAKLAVSDATLVRPGFLRRYNRQYTACTDAQPCLLPAFRPFKRQ